MQERKYYTINEETAKREHEMMSFRDYVTGSKTAEYMAYVDRAYEFVDQIEEKRPDALAQALKLADRYAAKLAENMNKESEIGTRCPSVMIAGGSNFNVKKKEKQVAAWDKNHAEWKEIQGMLDRLERILNGKEVIRSEDQQAIEKLEKKLTGLQEQQEHMKAVNAYYRKHKTLEGCPNLTEAQQRGFMEAMKDSYRADKPYQSWQLSNNSANIRRIKDRIAVLRKEAERETTETETEYFEVVENQEEMRIQLFFGGKPEQAVRDILKSHGFRWAPSQGAWQRQLNDNGRHAVKNVYKRISELQA